MLHSSKTRRISSSAWVVIFLGSLWFFTIGLSHQEVIGFDSRFYLFALEMWRHGITLFPTTYHQPYPDYPILSTLLIYVTACWAHGLDKCVAIFPTALAASVTLLLTYGIAASRQKAWGIASVCCLLLTVTFVKSARSISLDMSLTMVSTAVFYVMLRAGTTDEKRLPLVFYALLILGFAYRGPIGLIMPTGVGFVCTVIDRQYAKAWRLLWHAAVILLGLCALLLCLAYLTGGYSFVSAVLRLQALGRINNYYLPRYFYLWDSLGSYAITYPLAMVVCLGFMKHRRMLNDGLLMKLIAWVCVILLGMSIPDDKKVHYVLPMAPALALLAAYPLVITCDEKFFHHYKRFALACLSLLPLLLCVLFIAASYHPAGWLQHSRLPASMMILSLLVLQGAMLLITVRMRGEHRAISLLSIAALSFISVYVSVIEPIAVHIDRAQDFVQRVEQMRLQHHARLVFYKESPDGLAIKYLIHMTHETSPLFISQAHALTTVQQQAYFITSYEAYATLNDEQKNHFPVVLEGPMSHHHMIVFRNFI